MRTSIGDADLRTNLEVIKRDAHGNILQLSREASVPTTLIWSYGGVYPVAKILGLTYAQVAAKFSNLAKLEAASTASEVSSYLMALRTAIGTSGSVVTYAYDPLRGPSRITPENGVGLSYVYDDFGRLVKTSSDVGTLQEFQYNYLNK